MWQFLLGLGLGVYLGTYYECKPMLIKMGDIIKKRFPPKK